MLTDAVMYEQDDADLSGPIGLLGDKSELLIADGIESVQIVADEVLAAVWAAAPDPDDTNVGPVDESPADGPGDH